MPAVRAICAAAAVGLTAALVARHRLTRLIVAGHSMSPTLRDGQRIWLLKTGAAYPYLPGQIVVFEHDRGHGRPPMLVKRVEDVIGDRTGILVRGDGVRTLDSRQLGPIPVSSVRGVVLGRWR